MKEMYGEVDFKELRRDLREKYNLDAEIKDTKLCFDEFNGYIASDDRYCEVQELCESICYWIQDRYGCFCDYSILDSGYEFIIEVF